MGASAAWCIVRLLFYSGDVPVLAAKSAACPPGQPIQFPLVVCTVRCLSSSGRRVACFGCAPGSAAPLLRLLWSLVSARLNASHSAGWALWYHWPAPQRWHGQLPAHTAFFGLYRRPIPGGFGPDLERRTALIFLDLGCYA